MGSQNFYYQTSHPQNIPELPINGSTPEVPIIFAATPLVLTPFVPFRFASRGVPKRGARTPEFREFTKGGLVKVGLAIYAFPSCNCSTLGYVLMCKWKTCLIAKPPFTKPPFVNSRELHGCPLLRWRVLLQRGQNQFKQMKRPRPKTITITKTLIYWTRSCNVLNQLTYLLNLNLCYCCCFVDPWSIRIVVVTITVSVYYIWLFCLRTYLLAPNRCCYELVYQLWIVCCYDYGSASCCSAATISSSSSA